MSFGAIYAGWFGVALAALACSFSNTSPSSLVGLWITLLLLLANIMVAHVGSRYKGMLYEVDDALIAPKRKAP
jgi:membrane protein YdbS with pleckstrin-like domain